LCSNGYSDDIVTISSSVMIFCGLVASFPISLISYKTKKPDIICKISGGFTLIAVIIIACLFRMPDKSDGIIVACVLLGISAIGTYPVMLELLVECTYPYDQTIGTASLLLSSALQGFLLMETDHHLSYELEQDKSENPTQCLHYMGQKTKDYSQYLNFITVYMFLICLSFIIFFKTEMKRSNVDKESKEKNITKSDPEIQF